MENQSNREITFDTQLKLVYVKMHTMAQHSISEELTKHTVHIHTPLLLRKSIKSCLVRNFTAGDCVRLATLGIDAEDEGAVEPDGAVGVDEVDDVEGVDVEEADEEEGGDGVDAICDDKDAAEEGLGEAALVSEVPPLALDSPVV